MEIVLLTDFGSTFTKVTAVDAENAKLLGSGTAHTTVDTDIGDGLHDALRELERACGRLEFTHRYACSSAAGGLRMVSCGLVPELTAEAARLAALGAGAKVVKVYFHELTDEDLLEIESLKPDIFLLTGGTDGGNTRVVLHNAKALASLEAEFPIIYAGNRSCAAECAKLLQGREVIRCANVMPKIGALELAPVQAEIRELFLRRIINAKGLSRVSEIITGIMMPTPAAMLSAMELLSMGTQAQPGIGELMAVDLGGATTDVYSIAQGSPTSDAIILKGLPEPYSKRTVEGDIGMRYSAGGIVEAAGIDEIVSRSGLGENEVRDLLDEYAKDPGSMPDTPERQSLDYALACAAVKTAVMRHTGRLEEIYTPLGKTYVQTGKDLRSVKSVIATGGALIYSQNATEIVSHALYTDDDPNSLRPREPEIYIDRSYIIPAMGLLNMHYPDSALTIMRKELTTHGAD